VNPREMARRIRIAMEAALTGLHPPSQGRDLKPLGQPVRPSDGSGGVTQVWPPSNESTVVVLHAQLQQTRVRLRKGSPFPPRYRPLPDPTDWHRRPPSCCSRAATSASAGTASPPSTAKSVLDQLGGGRYACSGGQGEEREGRERRVEEKT
jgi:hypothetical protein